jgi:hypothetical protein
MKIGIIGYGFVGSTVANWLTENTDHTVVIVDPKNPDFVSLQEMMKQVEAAIICLPTPMNEHGEVDASLVMGRLEELRCNAPHVHVMIKSTMPTFKNHSGAMFSSNTVYNPEFLRQDTAEEDFKNQELFVIGVQALDIIRDQSAEQHPEAIFWTNIFAPGLPNAEFVYTDMETASMVKYTHNAWLATKVAFFHELSHKMPGVSNYNEMTNILAKFPNIGPSHMKVPTGNDVLGFAGACFPKDISAMYEFTQHRLLKPVMEVNEELKKKHNNVGISRLTSAIPDVPFILMIGTSHTYGQCGAERIKGYPQHIGEALGIHVETAGYPGVINQELLQMVNELDQAGWFKSEHLQLVILEPRLTENTSSLPFESILGLDNLIKTLDNSQGRNVPLINKSSLLPPLYHGREEGLLLFSGTTSRLAEHISANKLDGKYIKNRLVHRLHLGMNDEEMEDFSPPDFGNAQISDVIDHLGKDLTYRIGSMYNAWSDVNIINAIGHIVEAHGAKFRWFVHDERDNYIETLYYLTSNVTDVWDQRLLASSLIRGLKEKHGKRFDEAADKKVMQHLFCDCGHLSTEGGISASEILVPNVSLALANNKKERL